MSVIFYHIQQYISCKYIHGLQYKTLWNDESIAQPAKHWSAWGIEHWSTHNIERSWITLYFLKVEEKVGLQEGPGILKGTHHACTTFGFKVCILRPLLKTNQWCQAGIYWIVNLQPLLKSHLRCCGYWLGIYEQTCHKNDKSFLVD